MLEEVTIIGKMLKPDGVRGLFKLDIDERFEKSLLKANFIFIYIDGLPVPFRIEEKKPERGFLIRLEGIDTPEKVSRYSGLPLGLHRDDVKNVKKNLLDEKELWIHYTLYDSEKVVGVIEEIVLFPGQLMAMVKEIGGSILHIPLVEDWIISVDEKKKTICMELPEGLVDALG